MDGMQRRDVSTRSDTLLLYAARATRAFGDGFAVIILPAYLAEIGYGPFAIGIVAAVALFGTAATTLAVGFLGARRDLRNLLLIGAVVMTATGLALPNVEQLVPILIVAFIGTMNPSTGDLGLFVPLEHAMIAQSVPNHDRTQAFARYSLIGGLSTAAGALAAAAPDFLVAIGASRLAALKAMFYAYAALGMVGACLYQFLPHAKSDLTRSTSAGLGQSKGIVYRLAGLFSLDAFAGGFAVQSLVAVWLFEQFDLSLASA